jgi:hypothetical protein
MRIVSTSVKIFVVFLNTNGTKWALKYFLTISSLGGSTLSLLKQQRISHLPALIL